MSGGGGQCDTQGFVERPSDIGGELGASVREHGAWGAMVFPDFMEEEVSCTVRGLTHRTLRLRLPPYILLILLSFYFYFTCPYLLSPSGRTLRVLSVGPYYIHTFILRFIFNYRTISIYIISRTFYSLP